MVFICDGLNVDILSVQRSATAQMSSMAWGTSCGSAGLRSLRTDSQVWLGRRTRYSSRMSRFTMTSLLAMPIRICSKVDSPKVIVSDID